MNGPMHRTVVGLVMACGLAGGLTTASAQQVQRSIGFTNEEKFYAISPVKSTASTLPDGFIMAGYRVLSTANPDRDFYVVRTDQAGNVLWNVRVGGTSRDEAYTVTPTFDGGFVVAGETQSVGGAFGIGVIKLDALGNLLWSRALLGGGFADSVSTHRPDPAGPSVIQLSDGRIALVDYVRPTLGAAFQYGTFAVLDNTNGNVLAARQYQLAGFLTTSRLTFTDLRELPRVSPTAPVAVGISGTVVLPFQITGAVISDFDPLYVVLDTVGNPLFAENFPAFNGTQPIYETGDGLHRLSTEDLVLNGFFNVGLSAPVTGTHAIRLLPGGAPIWQNRYSVFQNHFAALTEDARGNIVMGGFAENLPILASPSAASMLSVEPTLGAVNWLRGYERFSTTIGTGVAAFVDSFTGQPGLALAGFGGPGPGINGPIDGLFVRTNLFGTTGCEEVSGLPDVRRVDRQPNQRQLIVLQSDFTIWQPARVVPQVGTNACVAVGPCNWADITSPGGTYDPITGTVDLPPDGSLSIEDFIVFLAAFSDGTGCPGLTPCNPADLTGPGGPPVLPDGDLSIEDFIAFLNYFTDGCP